MEFKIGDKVVIFQKIRNWEHGIPYFKDKALEKQHILTVVSLGDCNNHIRTPCVITVDFSGKQLTIFQDCLRPINKNIIIIGRKS